MPKCDCEEAERYRQTLKRVRYERQEARDKYEQLKQSQDNENKKNTEDKSERAKQIKDLRKEIKEKKYLVETLTKKGQDNLNKIVMLKCEKATLERTTEGNADFKKQRDEATLEVTNLKLKLEAKRKALKNAKTETDLNRAKVKNLLGNHKETRMAELRELHMMKRKIIRVEKEKEELEIQLEDVEELVLGLDSDLEKKDDQLEEQEVDMTYKQAEIDGKAKHMSDLERRVSEQNNISDSMVDEEFVEGVIQDLEDQISQLKKSNKQYEQEVARLQKQSDESELKATNLHKELLTAQAEVLTERELVKQIKQEAELEMSTKLSLIAHLKANCNHLQMKNEQDRKKSLTKHAQVQEELTRAKKQASNLSTHRRIDNQASREKIEKLQQQNKKLIEVVEEFKEWRRKLQKAALMPVSSPNGKRKLVVQQPDSTATSSCEEDDEVLPMNKKKRRYGKQI